MCSVTLEYISSNTVCIQDYHFQQGHLYALLVFLVTLLISSISISRVAVCSQFYYFQQHNSYAVLVFTVLPFVCSLSFPTAELINIVRIQY